MADKNLYELVKQVREIRIIAVQTIFLIGLIGILLGVFSNMIFSILWEPKIPTLSQVAIMGSIFLLLVGLIWKALDSLYFQHIGEEKEIKIVLPFLVTVDHFLVREIKSYDVTRVANEVTKKIFRREEYLHEQKMIKKEFDDNSDPFQQGLVRDITISLVQYLCLYYLGRSGEDSLGFSAPYHDGGYFPSLNPNKEKVLLDNSLKKNYFIEKEHGFKDKFLLPFCISPYLSFSGNMAENEWSNIVFDSKYGNIDFSVSPYISNVRGKKTHRVATRRLINEKGIGSDMSFNSLIEIDVKIRAKLKGQWIFKKEFRELADWLVYLFDYMKRHMDWEIYIEGETHRTLIDVDRKLDKILAKNLSA